MWFRLIVAVVLTSLAIAGCGGERSSHGGDRVRGGRVAAPMRDGAQVGDVMRRFAAASLAGDSPRDVWARRSGEAGLPRGDRPAV